jgi:hypothetical protein
LKERSAPEPLDKPRAPVVMEEETTKKEKEEKATKVTKELNEQTDKLKQE